MSKYNGHKNYNHWNVSLWINNDEGLYELAKDCVERTRHHVSFGAGGYKPRDIAAQQFVERLSFDGIEKTPDGAPYSVSAVRAAMVGM